MAGQLAQSRHPNFPSRFLDAVILPTVNCLRSTRVQSRLTLLAAKVSSGEMDAGTRICAAAAHCAIPVRPAFHPKIRTVRESIPETYTAVAQDCRQDHLPFRGNDRLHKREWTSSRPTLTRGIKRIRRRGSSSYTRRPDGCLAFATKVRGAGSIAARFGDSGRSVS